MKPDKQDEREYAQAIWLEIPQTAHHLDEISRKIKDAFSALQNVCRNTSDPEVASFYSQWRTWIDCYNKLKGTNAEE